MWYRTFQTTFILWINSHRYNNTSLTNYADAEHVLFYTSKCFYWNIKHVLNVFDLKIYLTTMRGTGLNIRQKQTAMFTAHSNNIYTSTPPRHIYTESLNEFSLQLSFRSCESCALFMKHPNGQDKAALKPATTASRNKDRRQLSYKVSPFETKERRKSNQDSNRQTPFIWKNDRCEDLYRSLSSWAAATCCLFVAGRMRSKEELGATETGAKVIAWSGGQR